MEDGPDLLSSMKEGLVEGDAPVVARSAHTMKSSARDFGLMELSQTCMVLEQKSKAGDLQDAISLVTDVDNLFNSGRASLTVAARGLKD